MGYPEEEAERQKVQEAGEEIAAFASEHNGTATGEHGIEIGKRKFIKREHGDSRK
jgi:D-lactate dehydrogenase (cytochrome)